MHNYVHQRFSIDYHVKWGKIALISKWNDFILIPFLGNVFLKGELQKDEKKKKKSNFDNFESAIYMK